VVTLHDFHTTCALFFRLREERELCAPDVDLSTCASCVARAHGLDAGPLLGALDRRQRAFAAELAQADALVCASQAQAAYWSAIPGVGARRPVVLPLPREAAIDPVPPPAVDGPLQVATWGGLVRGKGLLVLLDALRELPRGSIAVHHHGPMLDDRFAAELDAHPLAHALTRHGPFDHASLARAVRSYHLAVHPSLFLETHGLTTDEALDFGLPVLVPDRGAPQERIGTRGATFRVGDPHDLARVLRSVLDDRGQLERWRQGARAAQPSLAEHLHALAALGRGPASADAEVR
jgi:glycosyltransferase involved in cell wall biosynthesis